MKVSEFDSTRVLIAPLMVVLPLAALVTAELAGAYQLLVLACFFLLAGLCVPLAFRSLQWFEPVVAMGAMFALFAVAGLYHALTGFSTAEHAIHESLLLNERAPRVVMYVAFWWLAFCAGYAWVRREPVGGAKTGAFVRSLQRIDRRWWVLAVVACFSLAVLNLLYNIWLFTPGNPLQYLVSFGVSKYREPVNSGIYTTLGYNLFVVGLIFYRCLFESWTAKRFLIFAALLSVSLLAILIRGQIFYTFSVVLFLLVLEYFFSNKRDVYFRWAAAVVPILFTAMILAYFSRIVSVELYLAEKYGHDFDFYASFFEKLAGFGKLIFGKGNVPNLPAMMVYHDHFGRVEDYFWGASLVGWLSSFFPFIDMTYIGYSISDTWYPNNVGGIPPGVVHEFYANFGLWGGVVAAFALGGAGAALFNYFWRNRGFLLCVVYSALLIRFWFILPKVEFSVLSNAIWLFLPVVAAYTGLLVVNAVFHKRANNA